MITIIATALLSMATMKGDAMDSARKAFNNCLIETHNTAVAEKASPSDFIKTSDAACPTERAALYADDQRWARFRQEKRFQDLLKRYWK